MSEEESTDQIEAQKFERKSSKSKRLTTVVQIKQKKLTNASVKGMKNIPMDKCGFIYKYSPSKFVGWQKRYFVLKDRKLKYFKSNSADNMK